MQISERRLAEASRIREKYPDRIPVKKKLHFFFIYLESHGLYVLRLSHALLSHVGNCREGRKD